MSTSWTLLQTNACVITLSADVASLTQLLWQWPRRNALPLNSDQLADLAPHISPTRQPMQPHTTVHLAQLPQTQTTCCSTRTTTTSAHLHVYAEHPQTALAASQHHLPLLSQLFAVPQQVFPLKTANAAMWRQTLQAHWTVHALRLQLELTPITITMPWATAAARM